MSYQLLKVDVDESLIANEKPEDYVCRLALQKARAGWEGLDKAHRKPILGADTSVVIDGDILGKPADQEEAIDMLLRLSGKTHQVITAVSLVDADWEKTVLSTSFVTFRELSRAECETYWHTGEPADKAGSYAVQGKAAIFISRLEGSYSGVMGLPLYETTELLQSISVNILNDNKNK